MHEEIMIKDQRAKVAVTWAMVGRVKSVFIDTCLVDKNKEDNVVNSLWLVTSFVVLNVMAPIEPCIQRTVKDDRNRLLGPRCTVYNIGYIC